MNNNQFVLETLNRNTLILLECEDNVGQMKLAVDQLYRIYSRITGVTIDQLNQDKDILLPSGKAISRAASAHCLLEMKRTAMFLRGIKKAITVKLSEVSNRPIQILYAGTGPYGALLIPLLPFFKSTELCVDLLDINLNSLTALVELTGTLGLEKYIGFIYKSDATTFTPEKKYDIVICEAMLACLRNEPQVAIMQNLIPQLDEACIFVPEEISIDAWLINPKIEMDSLLYPENVKPTVDRRHIGNVFTISKHKLEDILCYKTLTIPNDHTEFPVLKLITTVKVFDDYMLSGNDSSITLPMQYYDFREKHANEVEFFYIQGEKPRIESSIK